MARTALLLGASGLVGGHVLRRLLADEAYERVTTLVRRPLGLDHPKLDERVSDFDRVVLADDVFSCLGTTSRKTPSQEDYRRVDFDLPLAVARRAAEHGAKRLLLVSSVGADARSSAFYLRLKGELDEAAAALPFEAVHLFRPSFLIGERAERRPGEAVMVALAPLFSGLLFGPLRKYRALRAETVANAMVRAALSDSSGLQLYEFDRIQTLG